MYLDNIKLTNKGIVFVDKHGNSLSSDEALSKITKRLSSYWIDFKLYLVHAASLHVPFHSIRQLIFLASGLQIGKGSTIHMGCKFFEPSGVVIGEDTKIGDRAFLDGRAPLRIGNHVDLASEVMIYNSEHDLTSSTFNAVDAAVEIADYVFIGPRAIILPGVKIGRGAVVAAGAIVTRNVEDFAIVAGVPATKIGERRNKDLHYKLGRARLFQ